MKARLGDACPLPGCPAKIDHRSGLLELLTCTRGHVVRERGGKPVPGVDNTGVRRKR